MSRLAKQLRTILEIPCIATPQWSLIQLRSSLGDNSPKHVFFQIYNHNIVIIMQTCNHFFELKKSNNTPLWYLDYQSSNYPWWTVVPVGQYKNIKVTFLSFLSYPTQQDTSHPLSMSSIVSSKVLRPVLLIFYLYLASVIRVIFWTGVLNGSFISIFMLCIFCDIELLYHSVLFEMAGQLFNITI